MPNNNNDLNQTFKNAQTPEAPMPKKIANPTNNPNQDEDPLHEISRMENESGAPATPGDMGSQQRVGGPVDVDHQLPTRH